MSSTSNSQNLLVNVFRPTYVYDANKGYIPKLVVSNVDSVVGISGTFSNLNVGDANSNVYIGINAGNPNALATSCNSTGITAVGLYAGSNNSNSDGSVFLGNSAGSNASNVDNSVYLGALTGSGNSNCTNSVYIGYNSAKNLSNASNEVAIGTNTIAGGTSNIYIGTSTGSTGSSNIFIGPNIAPGNVSNQLRVGAGSNIAIYGDLANQKLGINTVPSVGFDVSGEAFFNNKVGIQMAPTHSLDVAGQIYATNGILIGTGSAAAPTIALVDEQSTGIFADSNAIEGRSFGFSINGTKRVTVTDTCLNVFANLFVEGTFGAATQFGSNQIVSGWLRGPDSNGGNFDVSESGISVGRTVNIGKGFITDTCTNGYIRMLNDAGTVQTLDISGGNISNSATTRSSNFIGTAAASNSIGGVTLNNGILRASNGTSQAPAYTFVSDPSTGIHLNTASSIGFDTSGIQRMCISGTNVGIGTTAPGYLLDVSGTSRLGGIILGGGTIINAVDTYSSIGGIELSNNNIAYSGRITGSTANASNSIGGVVLSNNNITYSGIITGSTANASNSIGGVTLSNNNITYSGRITGSSVASNSIGGVVLSNYDVSITSTGRILTGFTSNFISGITLSNGSMIASPAVDTFMVATSGNQIYTSEDGINWTSRNNTVFGVANAVAWNGSLWVAVGEPGFGASSNSYATSTNGFVWVGRGTTGLSTTARGIAWNGSLWVAVGMGSGTNSVATSTDGITWSPVSNPALSDGYAIAWNGALWVAGGSGTSDSIATSTDGTTWVGRGKSILSTVYGVAWNGRLWVAVGSGTNTIATSTDGITWVGRGNAVFTTEGTGVAWNGSLWVATGSGTNTLATSSDGITWSGLGTTTFTTSAAGIAWNGSLWVANGLGTYRNATSPDGTTWTPTFINGTGGSSNSLSIASRGYVLPFINTNTFSTISTSGNVGFVGSLVGSNSATSNFIGGVVLSNGNVDVGNGSATNPTFSFINDLSSGIHLNTRNSIGFDTSGTQVMCISGTNVGIGTTTPAARLDVSGGSIRVTGPGAYGALQLAGSNENAIYVADSNTAVGTFTGYLVGQSVTFTGGGSNFSIGRVSAGTVNSVPALSINSSRNVGIGTTVPQYTLDVCSTGTQSMRVQAPTFPSIVFSSPSNDTSSGQIVFDATAASSKFIMRGTQGTPLTFETPGNNERMRISANGSVGIGTTSPGATLDVVGNFRVTSDAQSFIRRATSTSSSAYIYFDALSNRGRIGSYKESPAGVMPFTLNEIGGTVGIGTSNPIYPLDVVGVVSNNTAKFGAIAGVQAGILISGNGASDANSLQIYHNATNQGLYTGNSLPLHIVTNNIRRISVAANGNVGVGLGTTDAAYQLDVAAVDSSAVSVNMSTWPRTSQSNIMLVRGIAGQVNNAINWSNTQQNTINPNLVTVELSNSSTGNSFRFLRSGIWSISFNASSTGAPLLWMDVSTGNSSSAGFASAGNQYIACSFQNLNDTTFTWTGYLPASTTNIYKLRSNQTLRTGNYFNGTPFNLQIIFLGETPAASGSYPYA